MLKNLVRYEYLNNCGPVVFSEDQCISEHSGQHLYRARGQKDGSYYYVEKALPQDPEKNFLKRTGWKIHVSVGADDTARAWDLVAPLALDAGIEIIKVSSRSRLQRTERVARASESGKNMVIYDTQGADVNYPALLQQIENVLVAHNIKPSVAIKGDRHIPGSRYFYYVNDLNRDGKYLPAAQRLEMTRTAHRARHNLFGRADIFRDIRITQPEGAPPLPASPKILRVRESDFRDKPPERG